jgi:predicted negative regulator of RcsB-dependent stress response
MMDTNKKAELQEHEVPQVLQFIKKYGYQIGIGIMVVAVALMAANAIRARQANKRIAAETLRTSAVSTDQISEVLDQYSSTPSAPLALLTLARDAFNEGNVFQARAHYEQFLADYKKHELTPVAQFGLASCSEADGDFDGAIEQFKALTEDQRSFLRPAAIIGLARSLEQAGKPDDARVVLEDYVTEGPSAAWTSDVELALAKLNK